MKIYKEKRSLVGDMSYTVKIDAANKRGGKKYLKQINADNARWVLDKDAIEKSSRLDGYYAIQTSEKKVDPRTILSKHHDLWKIEESLDNEEQS
ncbi:hypothetical protein [Mesotoga sp. Brook.08.YT.4.2.5.4.]|uniref:hypothetical protein n=1 Tax=Mesotoga sp. Brook.08.YT.4.2.5.4. TaxID=1343998 RepID=UPI000DD45245|nr:hypothetical protein [Mesotoga sp. Brook.08.YT.4.2.5.4.]